MGTMTTECGFLWGGDENVVKGAVGVDVQLCEYAKNYCIVYLKGVNCIPADNSRTAVCELDLNKKKFYATTVRKRKKVDGVRVVGIIKMEKWEQNPQPRALWGADCLPTRPPRLWV